jgi:antitoxin component HigA of HigAB toxin-antitoxin module
MHTMIQTEEENRVALVFIERLMDSDPTRGSKQGQLLKLLAEEIEAFEKRTYPSNP